MDYAASLELTQCVRELRALLIRSLSALHQRMILGGDPILSDLSRNLPHAQRRPYEDARQLLRMEQARLSQAFSTALGERFDRHVLPAEAPAASLSLQDNAEVEESISVTGMAVRAEGSYAALLHDLNERLERLADALPDRLAAGCLSPWCFCEAFRDALRIARIDRAAKFPLTRVFERFVLQELQPFYREALELLDRHGVHAAVRVEARRPTPAPVEPKAPLLDPATSTLLQRFAQGQPPRLGVESGLQHRFLPAFAPRINDTHLAEDLLKVARGEPLPDFGNNAVMALRQRALLVGRMFNEILADPQFPPQLAPITEAFRFPAIKAALADPGFFGKADHPVRALINDMAMMAAATRIGGNEAVERFEGWAKRVLVQCDLEAESVREKAKSGAPLSKHDVERFLRHQAATGLERRNGLLVKIREAVDQDLALNSVHCEIPPPVQPLLRSGWAPMMARHMLREGADSEPYKSGMELLHRVLFALNPDSPNARKPAEREALRRDLAASLQAAGMTAPRVQELIGGLDQALDQFKTRDLPGVGAAPPAAARPATARPAAPAAAKPPAKPATATKPAAASKTAPPAPARVEAAAAAKPVPEKAPAPKTAPVVEAAAATPPKPAARPAAPVPAPSPPATATVPPAAPVAAAAAPVVPPPKVAAPTPVVAASAPPPAPTPPAPAQIEVEVVAEAAAAAEEPVHAATPPPNVVVLPRDLPTPQRLLEQLLKVGSWFRVYDRSTMGTRWLKLASWFPQVQRASFSEFDGGNALTIHARDFLEDLMLGRSEPIDIPPQTVLILQALRQRYAAGEGAEPGPASMVA